MPFAGLTFAEHLQLIEERAAAFRDAVAAAPSLDLPVPGSPGRSLRDLVHHVGSGRRKTAAIVAAGAADAPPEQSSWDDGRGAPRERDALLSWWTESVAHLMSVLRAAGPDRRCWTWWDDSPSPQTSGAWTRRQLCEVAVSTHDAQSTADAAQPIPPDIALDGFDDCQFTLCATTVPWPHDPAVVHYCATEGRSWRLELSPGGAHVAHLAPSPGPSTDSSDTTVDAWARASASDLVLFFYDRIPLGSLDAGGDHRVFDRLAAWDPSA